VWCCWCAESGSSGWWSAGDCGSRGGGMHKTTTARAQEPHNEHSMRLLCGTRALGGTQETHRMSTGGAHSVFCGSRAFWGTERQWNVGLVRSRQARLACAGQWQCMHEIHIRSTCGAPYVGLVLWEAWVTGGDREWSGRSRRWRRQRHAQDNNGMCTRTT
jgi:hypothetical protein